MTGQVAVQVVGYALVVVVAVSIFAYARTRGDSVRNVLAPLASAAGWLNLQPTSFFRAGVRGTWRSFPVALGYASRQKSTPQRLILTISGRADSTLIVKRRMHGWLTRPFTLFGPPLVELRQPAAQEFWVRADETALAERLFADDKLVSMISSNLVASYDEIRIDRTGVRITRSLDDRPVRAKYNFPSFTFRFQPEQFEPIAREQLALGEALAERLQRT